MKNRKSIPELSKAEYDILRVMWKAEKLTIREVHDQLQATYKWAYTTTKTMMDRMVGKKLLQREQFHGIFLYSPTITRPQGLVRMVQFFADRVLEMDASNVVSMFAQSQALPPDEIKELEALLKKDNKSGV